MTYCDANGKSLASSVIDCAKHALGVSTDRPQSPDKFSKVEWIQAVKVVAAAHPTDCEYRVEEVVSQYKQYTTSW